jgi:hypothetical protein
MDCLTETFCLIDDFCRQFEPAWHRQMLRAGSKKRRRKPELSLSELMTLLVLFHQIRFRQFTSSVAYCLSDNKPILSLIHVNALVKA